MERINTHLLHTPSVTWTQKPIDHLNRSSDLSLVLTLSMV